MGYHISISNGCNEGEAIPRKKYVCNHGGHSYTKILRSSSPTWQLKTSSIKTKNTSAAWHGVQYDSAVFMFIFVQFGMGMGEEGQRRERERRDHLPASPVINGDRSQVVTEHVGMVGV